MNNQVIIKVRGILRSKDNKILFCYNKKQEFYFLPGGTLEKDENSIQCLQREFQEENQLVITVGNFLGCLECHWQEGKNKYQELNLIFEINIQTSIISASIQPLEQHISFTFLPLQEILKGSYNILPSNVIKFLDHHSAFSIYEFESQLT